MALRIGVGGAASRYQVSGVVYGSAADGSLQPLAMARSAAWLEPGRASVRLQVDDASLRASGLVRPSELRDLRLTNPGRPVADRTARWAPPGTSKTPGGGRRPLSANRTAGARLPSADGAASVCCGRLGA